MRADPQAAGWQVAAPQAAAAASLLWAAVRSIVLLLGWQLASCLAGGVQCSVLAVRVWLLAWLAGWLAGCRLAGSCKGVK
jgi:hypothetical protein